MSFISQPISLFPIKPQRQVGSIVVNVVISEDATDELTITQQPVQQGAMISDHAFKNPTNFRMTAYLKDNLFTSLSKLYQNLLDLQNSRVPFDVVTPKRIYRNMLLKTLGQSTDQRTENLLSISMTFQEVIIVKVGSTTIPKSKQRTPEKTAKTEDAGKKSAALIIKDGIGKLFSGGL